jgi:hypothetical protein
MKKLILVFLILVPFFFAGRAFSFNTTNYTDSKSLTITTDPGEWVEYVCINGEWYKITHYSDGRPIDVTHIAKPPVE